MTREAFVLKYTYGLDGQEKVPFEKVVAILEDIAVRGFGATVALEADTAAEEAVIGTGDGYVVITPKNDANDIVHLPLISSVPVGHEVMGYCTATGCEIRVHPDDDTTAYLNNNNTTVNEAALAAGASFWAKKVSATRWILHNYSAAGAITAPTPD